VVLVSATLPNEVLALTQQFMTDPVRILVKRDELTLEVRARVTRAAQCDVCDVCVSELGVARALACVCHHGC
jgi:hypothetical protein